MIPGNAINLSAPIANFYSPDSIIRPWTQDYEKGGSALNDASMGLLYTDWTLYAVGTKIYAKRVGEDEGALVLTTTYLPSELNFTFDSNMQIIIAYVENTIAKLYWFDTVINDFVTTSFPGITSPRLSMDDKRPRETYSRDALFFYLKRDSSNMLCYRQQRDRYTIEYELMEVSPFINYIGRVGMAISNRLQIELLSIIDSSPQIVIINT